MSGLRIERVDGSGEDLLRDWLYVHNLIVPPDALSLADVRERAGRHRLDVAHRGDVLVGCSTVRPPTADGPATVIARMLPEHRRQGLGTQLYAHALAEARRLGADVIETVVLESNEDGLRFALARGYVEVERCLLPGDSIPYVDLRLA
ncbi:GNAT family N-acetyltransferase [Streptomyces sp. NPDC127106]|uniref:GNAT family N-acetyltransferase n=1 Tax=Streptomyces sp. NPDC127106 TaxID=3345360 RepID=UPI003637F57F